MRVWLEPEHSWAVLVQLRLEGHLMQVDCLREFPRELVVFQII